MRADAARLLVHVALTGLVIAIVTGLMLFSVRASEYAAPSVLKVKLALLVIRMASALWAHARYGWTLECAPRCKA